MTTQELIDLHVTRFGSGDLEGLVSEYHDDAVVITPFGALVGKAAVRPLLAGMLEEFSLPGVSFTLTAKIVQGDVAYLTWRAETPRTSYHLGSDTIVFRDGKIAVQTAALHATPKG
jgi:ketosteroid isomerase-like protein